MLVTRWKYLTQTEERACSADGDVCLSLGDLLLLPVKDSNKEKKRRRLSDHRPEEGKKRKEENRKEKNLHRVIGCTNPVTFLRVPLLQGREQNKKETCTA